MLLRGTSACYRFNPADPATHLKVDGKFNSVCTGERVEDGLKVIIKQLNPELRNDQKAVTRFRKEAECRIEHPNLVQVYDFIETVGSKNHQGNLYMVCEFVEGMDLKTMLAHKKYKHLLRPSYVLKFGLQLLDAIQQLHKNNIIHRDIKPSNIILQYRLNTRLFTTEQPRVKLIDLGLAKWPNAEEEMAPYSLLYSPPEQVLNMGHLVNESSDIYSLGMCLYELISGENLYNQTKPENIINEQLVMPLSLHRKVPKVLLEVLQKATSKNKLPLPPSHYSLEELEELLKDGMKKRYQSATEMQEALENVLAEIEPKPKPSLLRHQWLWPIFSRIRF